MNAKQRQFRHADYLEHMLDAIHLALSHIDGISKEDLQLIRKRNRQ